MQYDVSTPEQYIDALDDDWRRQTLLELRDIIKEKAPECAEGINYKMLSYSDERGVALHLNAQKQYVSLYVGDIKKIDPTGELLQGIQCGKGCVRLKKSNVVAATRVDEFIDRTLALWRAGADISC